MDLQSVLASVEVARERTARQIASLEDIVAAIVEGSELTSTDDEHDPEGATIAYERAQATALLRQARADADALVITRTSCRAWTGRVRGVPWLDRARPRGRPPTTTRCIRSAS